MGPLRRQMGIFGARHCRWLSLASVALCLAAITDGAAEPRFSASHCRQVLPFDATRGDVVRGAEALAAAVDGSTIYGAAYDRRRSNGDGIPPQGGLYAFARGDLLAGGPARVRSLAAGFPAPGGFRPHGVALYEGAGNQTALAVINRRYFAEAAGAPRYRPSVEIFRKGQGGWHHAATVEHPEFCNANDLAFIAPDSLVVSVHRSTCADFTVTEDVLGFPGGYLLRIDLGGTAVQNQVVRLHSPPLGFANGVAADAAAGALYVAETRAGAVSRFDLADILANRVVERVAAVSLGGKPDNITLARNGILIAAVYDDLLALAAYRYRWFGTERTGSKIVAVHPDGRRELLFEDQEGTLFPAASSAVLADGTLVAGSVGADGLLVCGGAERP